MDPSSYIRNRLWIDALAGLAVTAFLSLVLVIGGGL